MAKTAIKEKARHMFDPVVSGMSSLGVPPMAISLVGLVLGLYGAYVLARGFLFQAGVWLLLSGIFDVLDGAVARHRGMQTKFGAFIDSTFDRISELAYLCALIVYYMLRPQGFSDFIIVVVCVVLSGSILVSYARARIEGLGLTCSVGLMERPERLALLVLGLFLGSRVLSLILVVLAAATTVTVLQRVLHAYRLTREQSPQSPAG
ncbi:MAG: CDP-alcohol phosphatidyltransferase family protein [Candidatus Krumholzibacteriia bacterium]